MPLKQFPYEYVLLAHLFLVNKHGGLGLVTNDFLTRNSSTLRPLELNVQPRFYCFSSLSEHKHMCDRSIQVCLVSCFPQFVCAFTLLSVLSKKPSHALGIPIVSTAMPLDFQFKEPPSPCPQNSKKLPVVYM